MDHEFIRHLKEDHDKQRSLAKRLTNSTSSDEREKLRNEFRDRKSVV